VLKITNAEPGLVPPVVVTLEGSWDDAGRSATLNARLESLGDTPTVRVGFEYRRKKGSAEMYEEDDPWKALETEARSAPGAFSAQLVGPASDGDYEFRALVQHPKVTLRGQVATLERAR
jgi:hypothetical protein